MNQKSVRKSWAARLAIVGIVGIGAATAYESAQAQLPTTVLDYQLPGTQPLSGTVPFQASFICGGCHGGYDDAVAPKDLWSASMMAQSARDPIFFAALAIANQDGAESGDLCLRCHAPGAWLAGRATPADGSALDAGLDDLDGVTCHFCHRMVDPIANPNNPAADTSILANLTLPPGSDFHSGQYVIDPNDARRGPFDLGPGFSLHTWSQSEFHRDSQMCATCHDVSNPIFERQPNGDYTLTANNTPHPDNAYGNVFPLERTYSEWLLSVYGVTELDLGGRFGGDKPEVASCQDCHMPDVNASACAPGLGETRPDMPRHYFNGANSWVLRAVDSVYDSFDTGLSPQRIADAEARTIATLQSSADVETYIDGNELVVRITNYTGHKLPTGYAEGRRMWLEISYENAMGEVTTNGAYNTTTAELDTSNTKVYEIKHGLDNYMAAQTGMPAGDSFHFVLNNEITKDNRIPPRGYDSAAFEAIGAEVVGANYMEQQHWDETRFPLPPASANAISVKARLFHQTTTKEYIEFLRDTNVTNTAGQDAYNLWEQFGKSAPVLMGESSVSIAGGVCATPVEYGLGKPVSLGGFATLSTTGSPSLAANDLTLEVKGGIPGQLMVAFRGASTVSLDHFGGRLLVFSQFRDATQLLDSNGEASIPIPITIDMVGTSRAYQVLFRDNASTSGVGMTSAMWITFCE